MSLLLDALDRTLKEPQCARRWHYLLAVWRQAKSSADRRSVLSTLGNAADGDARADVMRLTFLAGTTGDSRYENAAAARILAVEPPDADRLAGFMAYQWLNALQNLDGRAEFVAALSAAQMPNMAQRLMRDAMQTLPSDFAPRVPDTVRRVAVVVPYIGNPMHTPSMLAVRQSAVLAREGCQVRIFSAQELLPPDSALFRGDGSDLLLPPLTLKAWANILPAGVNLTVSDSRFSLPGRWRNLMPEVAKFNPDVVLLVGLYSPLAAALHTVRPVVGISVNTVAPIAPLDTWLTADEHLENAGIWGATFPPPQALFYPYRVQRSSAPGRVSRVEIGLGETALVWITAGFRLEHEIRGEWAEQMLQLLSAYPQVTWLLVGGSGKIPQALSKAPPGRVRALATRNDMAGIFRSADIYVNPPRMGGGFSVAEAMAEGLPVVSLAGSDGGDKVGELALENIEAYTERLAGLTENIDLRTTMGKALAQRFAERYDLDAAGPALLAACRQAIELAAKRFTGTS